MNDAGEDRPYEVLERARGLYAALQLRATSLPSLSASEESLRHVAEIEPQVLEALETVTRRADPERAEFLAQLARLRESVREKLEKMASAATEPTSGLAPPRLEAEVRANLGLVCGRWASWAREARDDVSKKKQAVTAVLLRQPVRSGARDMLIWVALVASALALRGLDVSWWLIGPVYFVAGAFRVFARTRVVSEGRELLVRRNPASLEQWLGREHLSLAWRAELHGKKDVRAVSRVYSFDVVVTDTAGVERVIGSFEEMRAYEVRNHLNALVDSSLPVPRTPAWMTRWAPWRQWLARWVR